MNILVTGANGQLGNEIRLVSRQSEDRYVFTDVTGAPGVETVKLDITDIESIRKIVSEREIGAIINCAAWTNVDGAEDPAKYALVEKLNADAPGNLAAVMAETGGILFHISTDYVFGGDSYNVPCKEEQKGTPTGVYGLTKLHGEQKIKESGCRHIIIRTAWLYSEFGKNFLKTMLHLTSTKPSLKVVFDQAGTPTYALDLAKTILTILERMKQGDADGLCGVYHYSDEGVCSWYDFTKMIATAAAATGLEEYAPCLHCDIRPCHSSEFPSPVKRPAYSVLDKTKIKETFGIRIPYWVDSMYECIDNLTAMNH